MAGHSKWAQIKRQKGLNDAKRGAVFTKMGSLISIAARSGTDPITNPSLAMAIERAKAVNMPYANIERAIDRAKDKAGANLEEVVYEGYGQGGIAILVEAATDNRNRTFPEVRTAFVKNGGNIAESGSVAYQFTRKGQIMVKASGDEAVLDMLDAGAEDVSEFENELFVYTDMKMLKEVYDNIVVKGYKPESMELIYNPNVMVDISDEVTAQKIEKLLEAIDDVDDVINVYSNYNRL